MKFKALIIITMLCLSFSKVHSQRKGDLIIGYGFGLISKGGLSIKFFPVDGFGIELSGGGIPHIYNYGLYLNYYPTYSKKKVYFVTGYSKIGGSTIRPRNLDKFFKDYPDTLLQTGACASGITFGLGYEQTKEKVNDKGDIYYENLFLGSGPTYLLDRKINFINKNYEKVELDDIGEVRWSLFVEGGIGRLFK